MEPVTAIATVPAVLALVTIVKDLGLPSKMAPIVAILLGIGMMILQESAYSGLPSGDEWYQVAAQGLILGLSASGFYDGAKLLKRNDHMSAPKHSA